MNIKSYFIVMGLVFHIIIPILIFLIFASKEIISELVWCILLGRLYVNECLLETKNRICYYEFEGL